jgi:4-amino-4-deoxy-L-arabinose transferase-like glycosyltransferase
VIRTPPDLSSVRNENSWLDAWRSPDSHPPLYAMLLRAWRQIVGEGDAPTRGLSVLASLAAIVFLFDIGRVLGDERTALWACAMMAAAQPEIQYAQEARGYALWTALALAAGAAAARLAVRGPGWRRAAALAGCLAAMMLTHFLAIGTALALVIWCAIYLRGRSLRQAAVIGLLAACLLCLIGIQLARQDHGTQHNTDWLRQDSQGHIVATIRRAALLPAQFLADPAPTVQWAAAGAAVVYLLPWLLGGRLNIFCGLWLAGGVGFVFALDLIAGTAALKFIRFTLVAAPAVYLLIAALPVRGKLRTLLPLSAVICALLALPGDYETTWKGQWRQLGGDVRLLARPGDIVVFASLPDLFLADPLKMYEGVDYYAHPIPCPVLLLNQKADGALQARLRQAARVWVVFPDGAGSLNDYLPGWRFSAAAPKRRLCGAVWRASTIAP